MMMMMINDDDDDGLMDDDGGGGDGIWGLASRHIMPTLQLGCYRPVASAHKMHPKIVLYMRFATTLQSLFTCTWAVHTAGCLDGWVPALPIYNDCVKIQL